jgi:hypothetical protein
MGSQPFIYNIPDSVYVNGSGSYDVSWCQLVRIKADAMQIQVQLKSGTNYIVVMSDAFGLAPGEFGFFLCSLPNHTLRADPRAGGVSEIQQVAGSQSAACLNTTSRNQTASQFFWSVSGQANQCHTPRRLMNRTTTQSYLSIGASIRSTWPCQRTTITNSARYSTSRREHDSPSS